MRPDQLADAVRERLPDVLVVRDEVVAVVDRDDLLETMRWLRDRRDVALGFLADVTATDWPETEPRFWLAYDLRSLEEKHRLRLKVGLPGEDAQAPSVTPMFPTANWQEREVFDFYGIVFDGHPDLTRIDDARRLGGVSAPQDRSPRRGPHVVRRRDDAADRRTGHGVSSNDLPRAEDGMDVARDGLDVTLRDAATGELRQETMIINMGPQHPSTHGVLRLLLELDGETVVTCKPVIGYLHTGIEKNTEYRTWMQGVTYVTRADYLSPFFNELGYCLAVERLLGIEAPPRAQVLRVLVCELNRISSHLVWLATGGLELGAVSVMLYGFREREMILDIFEAITGLRMNHAYIRIGGVVMDLPDGGPQRSGSSWTCFRSGSTSTRPS